MKEVKGVKEMKKRVPGFIGKCDWRHPLTWLPGFAGRDVWETAPDKTIHEGTPGLVGRGLPHIGGPPQAAAKSALFFISFTPFMSFMVLALGGWSCFSPRS